jgi:hypothetical protein
MNLPHGVDYYQINSMNLFWYIPNVSEQFSDSIFMVVIYSWTALRWSKFFQEIDNN